MNEFGLATWAHNILDFGQTPDEMRIHLDRLAENGFNILIPCIKNMPGAVDFRTDLADMTDVCRKWDPFGMLVEESIKRGMQVHAWLINFSENATSRFRREHPDTISTIDDPYGHDWLCACRENVRDYVFSLYEDLAKTYHPAGLHLDYIRTGGWCTCEICTRAMAERGINIVGVTPDDREAVPWATWKSDQVTDYVRRMHEMAEMHGIALSAAIIGDYPHFMNEQGQDWERWVSEGILDMVFGMNYNNSARLVDLHTTAHLAHAGGRVPVWEGLCKSAGKTQLSAAQLGEQVDICRARGAAGVSVFSYPALSDEDMAVLKATTS
jgi:uncharacterized lipoprotein YddW (UPF0748 family)